MRKAYNRDPVDYMTLILPWECQFSKERIGAMSQFAKIWNTVCCTEWVDYVFQGKKLEGIRYTDYS